MTLAARKAGFEPEITYPDRDESIRIDLALCKSEGGALFAAIPKRQNTRSEFDGRKLGVSEIADLLAIILEQGISLHVFDDAAKTESVLEYVTRGNVSQFEDHRFMEELVHWIRFDKRESLASLDGLFSRCMGTPQVPRWIGRPVVRRTKPQSQSDADSRKLRSSSGAIAIASTTDDKEAWVRTGQVYQRLALHMTSMNIKSAFLNQPCEVPGVRDQFQSAMGFGVELPQLLLRYGYADSMPWSYRRPVDDVIVWS